MVLRVGYLNSDPTIIRGSSQMVLSWKEGKELANSGKLIADGLLGGKVGSAWMVSPVNCMAGESASLIIY